MRQPKLLVKIWAAIGLKNTIPESRDSGLAQGAATYDEGFPSITMTPIAQGGKAPSGKDMNGILHELSAHIVHINKGGHYKFDENFAEKINGYSKGAVLINNDETAFFVSLVNQNKTNFNIDEDYSRYWVKLADIDAIKQIHPKDLTEESVSEKDHTGHSHKLPLASLIKKGIAKLYSGLDSNSEEMAATPRAIKRLKDLIDANIRNFGNFIPNSKKSNATNSASSDTVATSFAVKTAYDKGLEAKTAADNALRVANAKQSPATTLAGYGIGDGVNQSEIVGMVAYFSASSAPNGWLKANGATVSRTTYAALFARIGTTFGAGDGRTTFNLPDLRAEFIRGLDDGRNIDSNRRLGSAQGDAIRNITGTVDSIIHNSNAWGAFAVSNNAKTKQAIDWQAFGNHAFNFDASRVVPTANENRPRNIALLACIKY